MRSGLLITHVSVVQALVEKAKSFVDELKKKAGVRVTFDPRDNYTPGWKYNHWELKARPLYLLAPRSAGAESCLHGACCWHAPRLCFSSTAAICLAEL